MFSNHIGFKISGYFLTAITTVVSCSTCWNLTPCSWSPISDMLASMLGQPCFRRVLKNFLCSCSFFFFWKCSLLPLLSLHVSLVEIFQPCSDISLSAMHVTMFGKPCVRTVVLKTMAASHTVGLFSSQSLAVSRIWNSCRVTQSFRSRIRASGVYDVTDTVGVLLLWQSTVQLRYDIIYKFTIGDLSRWVASCWSETLVAIFHGISPRPEKQASSSVYDCFAYLVTIGS